MENKSGKDDDFSNKNKSHKKCGFYFFMKRQDI